MGIFINSAVASCEQPAILPLFWDQEYPVLLTGVLSSFWICFQSKANFLFCTFFPLYYSTCHCCSFNICFAKTTLKVLFFLPLTSFLVLIQVDQEPFSSNLLIFLGEFRFFFNLNSKYFLQYFSKLFVLVGIITVCSDVPEICSLKIKNVSLQLCLLFTILFNINWVSLRCSIQSNFCIMSAGWKLISGGKVLIVEPKKSKSSERDEGISAGTWEVEDWR